MVLYKLHADILATRIVLFEGMPLPNEDGSVNDIQLGKKHLIGVGDGVSDENPIVMDMHMATSDELNSLLDLI